MGIVIIVAVVLFILVLVLGGGRKNGSGDENGSGEVIVNGTDTVPENPIDQELQKDAIPQLNDLVHTYFEAMKNCDAQAYSNIVAGDEVTEEKLQKKGEFIEDYRNISCYTKPGMTEGSYVAYIYYEVKFHNIDTLTPALSQLYICTNEDGTMYINAASVDPELAGYLSKLNEDEQVLQLNHDVEKRLNDACAADENLAAFVELLNRGAGYEPEEETTAEEPETDISEMIFEERDEKVLTTTTVRVRSTPDTESDDNVLGKIEAGEELKRVGYNDKWSKVIYQKKEAYVSSDYLITK